MSKLFISYNHKDQLFVQAIKEKLAALGYPDQEEIFYDETSLIAGDDWVRKIQEAIFSSARFIVFIGSNGIGRFQQKEVLAAINEQAKKGDEFSIIPVIISQEGNSLSKEIPWFLADCQWVEFIGADDNNALDKLLQGIRKNDATAAIVDKDPYKGLNFFEVDDSPFFFGRQFDVNWVFYRKLKLGSKTLAKSFLAIIGSSGSGKSSFVRAGLLAALKDGRYIGSGDWPRIIMTPGQKPLSNLSAVLENKGIIKSAYDFCKEAATDKNRLYLAAEVYQNKFVLFIDQLEEVISQCNDETERAAFLNNIAEASRSNKILILSTVRTDFYSRFSQYKAFADLIEESNYTMEDIELASDIQSNEIQKEDRERKLRDIISKPAGICGVETERALVQKLVEETKGINGPLPVLQMTLSKLWKQESRKKTNKITSSDFDQLSGGKGLDGIFEKHADDVFDEFTDKGKDQTKASLVKNIFIRLVELTENKEDVRKSVNKGELVNQLSSLYVTSDVEAAISFLSGPDARLIRLKKEAKIKQEDKDEGKITVEVVHEVLIRKWGKLVGWVNERREALKYQETLLKEIEKNGKRKKYFSGNDLTEAKNWLQANADLADSTTIAFIRRSGVRANWTKVIGCLILVVSIAAGLYIYDRIQWSVFKENSLAKRYNINKLKQWRSIELEDSTEFKFLHYYSNCDSLTISVFPSAVVFDKIKNQLSKIKYLKLANNSDEVNLDLSFLKYATSLKEIRFSGCDITNLECLKYIKDVRKLSVSESGLKTLSGLENLPEIDYLELSGNDSLQINNLDKISRIDSIYLDDLTIEDLSFLKDIKGLNSLTLTGNEFLLSLTGIENIGSLTQFSINGLDANFGKTGLLEVIDFSNWKSNSKLEDLKVYGLSLLKEIKGLNTLVSLQSLYISNLNSLTPISLNDLNNLHRLKTLTFGSGDSTLSGIEHFDSLQYIELIVDKNFLTNDLPYLKLMPEIKKLELHLLDTVINWIGVNELHQADTIEFNVYPPYHFFLKPSLQSFNSIKYLALKFISFIEFKPGEIDKLKLLRSLKEITLMGYENVQEEHLNMLRKELPGCKIKS